MSFDNTPRGNIDISWEIKDADGISVSVMFSPNTERLPYVYRKYIAQALRERILAPRRTPRKEE